MNLCFILTVAVCAEAFVANKPTFSHDHAPELKMANDDPTEDGTKVCLITGASRGIGKW